MMNMFQIIDVVCTEEMQVLIAAVKTVLSIVGWVVPIILIIYGTIDIFKAMTSGDEKVQNAAWQGFIKRIVYAIIIFLVPFIVKLAFGFVGTIFGAAAGEATIQKDNFFVCYNGAKVKKTCYRTSGSGETKIVDKDESCGIGYTEVRP